MVLFKISRPNFIFILFSIALLGTVVAVLALEPDFLSRGHRLAPIFNQDSLEYDRNYADEYRRNYQNFSDLRYSTFEGSASFTMTMGNAVNDLKGFRFSNGDFAFHLVYCDEFQKFCKFRINGVPTTRMYAPNVLDTGRSNSFDFHQNYTLVVEGVRVNQCDNHRFCHLGYEGYHAVDVSIVRRG